MSRSTVTALITVVAVLLAIVVGVPFVLRTALLWDGASQTRTLRSGDTITLESGLTLTVPDTWEGSYTRYYDLPSWLPLGENANGMHRLEELSLEPTSPSDSTIHVVARSYYRGGPPSFDVRVLASDDSVTVLGGADEPLEHYVRVETTLDGHPVGYVFFSADSGEQLDILERGWALVHVQGVSLP